VWPSPPAVGPLRGPPLCVGPLWVGASPVVFPFPVASAPRLASRSRSRSRSITTPLGVEPAFMSRRCYELAFTRYSHLCLRVQESSIPLLPLSIRIAHTTAIRWRDFCAIYDPPPPPPPILPVDAIHHTILVMTISCNG